MNRSSFNPIALLPSLVLLALVGYTVGPPSDLASRAPSATPDTIAVFVVWGASNACGPGQEELSPVVPDSVGFEWTWSDTAATPLLIRHLDDPTPCRNRYGFGPEGVSEEDGWGEPERPDSLKGSAWPQFAITYNAQTGGPLPGGTGRVFFMTSLAVGGTEVAQTPKANGDWFPVWDSLGKYLYHEGVGTIANAMAKAEALRDSVFPGSGIPVVFGGVLWINGNDLDEELYPWANYASNLDALLTAFSENVIQGLPLDQVGPYPQVEVGPYPKARLYFANTPSSLQFEPDSIAAGLDVEAAACARFAFCSMTQESEGLRARYDACQSDSCRAVWYNNPTHWAQRGLDSVGASMSRLALRHEAILASGTANEEPDPFLYEVGVEVPLPVEDRFVSGNAYTYRLRVYDDDGAPVDSFTVTPSVAYPDWTADFDADADSASWQQSWTTLSASTDFLTFEFVRRDSSTQADSVLARYAYAPTALATGSQTDFYRPLVEAGQVAAVRFEVFPDGSVQAGPERGQGPATERVGPAFEDVFAGSYVLPYNEATYEYEDNAAGTLTTGFFLARLPAGTARPTTSERRFTFAEEGDVILSDAWGTAGTLAWDVPGLVLAFPVGRQLVIGGVLEATGTRFTEAVADSGWAGLQFNGTLYDPQTAGGTLSGVTVEHVAGPTGVAGDAAVEVLDAVLTIERESRIENGMNVHGVWAYGPDAEVTVDSSFVQTMLRATGETLGGTGVVAAGGAEIRVYNSTTVQLNAGTGAAATGMESTLFLHQSEVLGSGVYGVAGQASAEIQFRPHDAESSVGEVEVSRSGTGGLVTTTMGAIHAGNYTGGACLSGCENQFIENLLFGNFDARAHGIASVVEAEHDYWGDKPGSPGTPRDSSDLVLQPVSGGTITFSPIWSGPGSPRVGSSPDGNVRRASRARGSDGSTAPRGGLLGQPDSSAVGALVDAARIALAQGDSAAAGMALLTALPLAEREAEYGLAFGTTARFLARGGDQLLEAYLEGRIAPEDPARPWALTALLAADAIEGRVVDARGRADALARDYPETDHALVGLGMMVRLAAATGDLASAQTALGTLTAGWPEALETEAAAARVRYLEEALAPAGRVRGVAPVVASAEGEVPEAFRLLHARPNPTTGRTTVPFEVAAPSRVRVIVYDILGRKVAVLADGPFEPGRHAAEFDGRALASGLYLVRATVEAPNGTGAESGAIMRRSYVRRITLVR